MGKWEGGKDLFVPYTKKVMHWNAKIGDITLLNTLYKVFSNIPYARLKPYAEKITVSYQSGIRDGKSTTNQIQALCQVLKRI